MNKEYVQLGESNKSNNLIHSYESNWPFVFVEWIDAESDGGPGWQDPEDMMEYSRKPLPVMKTVGMLVWEDSEKVVITDSKGPSTMGGVTKIPKAWLKSYYTLDKSMDNLEGNSPRLVI